MKLKRTHQIKSVSTITGFSQDVLNDLSKVPFLFKLVSSQLIHF